MTRGTLVFAARMGLVLLRVVFVRRTSRMIRIRVLRVVVGLPLGIVPSLSFRMVCIRVVCIRVCRFWMHALLRTIG